MEIQVAPPGKLFSRTLTRLSFPVSFRNNPRLARCPRDSFVSVDRKFLTLQEVFLVDVVACVSQLRSNGGIPKLLMRMNHLHTRTFKHGAQVF